MTDNGIQMKGLDSVFRVFQNLVRTWPFMSFRIWSEHGQITIICTLGPIRPSACIFHISLFYLKNICQNSVKYCFKFQAQSSQHEVWSLKMQFMEPCSAFLKILGGMWVGDRYLTSPEKILILLSNFSLKYSSAHGCTSST